MSELRGENSKLKQDLSNIQQELSQYMNEASNVMYENTLLRQWSNIPPEQLLDLSEVKLKEKVLLSNSMNNLLDLSEIKLKEKVLLSMNNLLDLSEIISWKRRYEGGLRYSILK